MSYFKKFTDILAAISAFFAALLLTRSYMNADFSSLGEVGLRERLDFLLDGSDKLRSYAILFLLTVLALLVGRFFEKLPSLVLAVSLLPALFASIAFMNGRLDERPMFYLITAVLYFIGSLYDTLFADRTDRKRRAFYLSAVTGVLFGALQLALIKIYERTEPLREAYFGVEISDEELARADRAYLYGLDILSPLSEEQATLMTHLAVLLIGSAFISLLLRRAYFIDLILSAFMLDIVIVKWHGEIISVSPALTIAPIAIYFALRLGIFFLEPTRRE